MRIKTVLCLLGLAALVSGAASSTAMAEQNVPGSVLVFPYVDSNSSSPTIISVSNLYLKRWAGPVKRVLPGGNEVCDPGPPETRFGDTGVYFLFFDSEDCLESNFWVWLTPADHVTFVIDDKIPDGRVGWMVAFAFDPAFVDEEIKPWSFDFLVGIAHAVDARFDLSWTYNAYAFLSSKWDANGGAAERGRCGKYYIDHFVGNNDGILDFDGTEYEKWGDELYLPRFFEEANEGQDYDSLLSLISPLNTIEEQGNYETTASILFWNNDENENGFPFSKTVNFTCQLITSLHAISPQFGLLEGTELEEPTGWAIFDGYLYRKPNGELVNHDPPMLGVFAQINRILGGDPAQHTGGNNFFTRGFNDPNAKIQYRFGQ
jgi:hypothetical protein